MKSNLRFISSASEIDSEILELHHDGLSGQLAMFTGTQGDFIVSIVPSLNVSGYGRTETEALESLSENLDTFFSDFFALEKAERHQELHNLGWSGDFHFEHPLSPSYIDNGGVLKNFDFPEKVKKTTLQAA
ncbi:hypothetical protein [Dyadobacter luticola]|uniref:Uncharacterized protein n=1 Tax=Dyadobacter luticola TaxID=1979387 RepID=A0A5R9L459_9BACT|nr:hypothetical protein [Dyadobacter luticola]TLV03356.1 hypothetical protein FEN17_07030 [Dyadobacter luticola]